MSWLLPAGRRQQGRRRGGTPSFRLCAAHLSVNDPRHRQARHKPPGTPGTSCSRQAAPPCSLAAFKPRRSCRRAHPTLGHRPRGATSTTPLLLQPGRRHRRRRHRWSYGSRCGRAGVWRSSFRKRMECLQCPQGLPCACPATAACHVPALPLLQEAKFQEARKALIKVVNWQVRSAREERRAN